ncbi:MAG: hypothetical protein AB8V06_06980 [Francisella endosymbiont of Hyalomma asiaticum]
MFVCFLILLITPFIAFSDNNQNSNKQEQKSSSINKKYNPAVVNKVNAEKTLIIGLPNLGLTTESKQIGNQNLLKEVSSLHNQFLKEFAESQINIEFVDMNPILEMLANDTDNFNKKYQTVTDPNKTTQSCWNGGYFAYQLNNQSMSNFY